jgi:hypothetical protein
MAATCDVKEINGVPAGVYTTITNSRLCSDDVYNPATSYPVAIPAAGTNYSFWKSLCLEFTGVYTQVTNVTVYTGGTLGWGLGCVVYVGDETLGAGAYEQATGTVGTTGDEMVATHGGITAKTDLFTYTSLSKKSVDVGPITGSGSRSNHIVVQGDVDSTATQGVKPADTITFTYDEV